MSAASDEDPRSWVVRVRIRNFCWTTPAMPLDDAQLERNRLCDAVEQLSAGTSLVSFDATSGREVAVRAADVVAVAPWTERPVEHYARGGVVQVPADVTSWLQQKSGHVPLDAAGGRS